MNIDFDQIIILLKEHLPQLKDQSLDRNDFEKYKGISNNNSTYFLKCKSLHLVIRVGKEHQTKEIFEKTRSIKKILENKDVVDIPKVLLIDEVMINKNNHPLMVQEYIEGIGASTDYKSSLPLYIEMGKVLYKLHSVEIDEFKNILKPKSQEEWFEFLKEYISEKLELLNKFNVIDRDKKKEWEHKFNELLSKYKNQIIQSDFVPLHGDVFQENFIIKNGKIVGLVDWDFALIGDRAFEFSSAPFDYIQGYCTLAKKENKNFNVRNFKKRVEMYKPITSLGVMVSTARGGSIPNWLDYVDYYLDKLLIS